MTATSPPPPTVDAQRRRRQRARRIVLVVALVLAAAVTAARLARVTDDGGATLAGSTAIEVTGGSLDVTLVEDDSDEVVVTWATERAPWVDADVTVREIDGTVVVTADCAAGLLASCSTRAELHVPRGTLDRLAVDVAAGSISLAGTTADVTATTGAGTISLTGHGGATALLRAATGRVEVDATTPPTELDVLVGTGDVQVLLPDADYDLAATTGVGTASTSVREVDGAPHVVRVRVEVGDVDVTMR